MGSIIDRHLESAKSTASNFTTVSVEVDSAKRYCVSAFWTGTAVGDLQLQASVDDTNWHNIDAVSALGGAAGNFLWEKVDHCYRYIRVDYAFTSSTGTINIKVFGLA